MTKKASDLFVRCLESEEVHCIYGVPGEENADLLMSLAESSIELVLCRHEQGAAFMADVEGRLTGRPGVCLSTLGPGATNLVTGVANANFDHSPVVAITGQAATRRLHKESHQNMDVVAMLRPITKWNATVHAAETIPEVVRKAFKLAAAEKPGATHVELPEDVAKVRTEAEPFREAATTRRPAPDAAALRRALELLAAAESPIVLAGNGCIRKRASAELRTFVKRSGIHAVNTFMAKGAIAADDPRCLYAAGLGSRDHVTEAFEKADVVLAIGYDMIEWHPDRWNVGREKRIIHVDFEPAEVDDHYQVDSEIVGDVASTLAALNASLGPEHQKSCSLFSHLRDHVTREIHEHDEDDGFPVKPQRILSDLRSVLRRDDILISDVGAHKMWVARNYPVLEPGTCIISNGFCSMGIAVPGAIAAKRTLPDRNVVGLVGDAGFLMNVQELATAVQYGVAPTYLVWEDGGFGLIAWKQENEFGRHVFTDFDNPDLARVAEAFGCLAIRVGSAAELVPALRRALSERERPAVVVVPVDYRENARLTRRLGELISH